MTTRTIQGDVVIVGAGPAGLVAAQTVLAGGLRPVIIDDNPNPGGQIWRHDITTGVHRDARGLVDAIRRGRIVELRKTSIAGVRRVTDGFALLADSPRGALEVRCRSIVLACGARELFLPFPGWTLPNVFGVGGAQALVKSGMSVRGRRVVIAGSGPLLLPVAASMRRAGAKLLIVAEQASLRQIAPFIARLATAPSHVKSAVAYRLGFLGTPYRQGTWVARAEGDRRVQHVVLTDGRRERGYDCDVLCAAFGLVPNVELARSIGCESTERGVVVDALQQTTIPGVFAAGEMTGIAGVESAMRTGAIAAAAAVHSLGGTESGTVAVPHVHHGIVMAMRRAFALRPELSALATPTTIVCRCEDIPLGAIAPEWDARQAKLYARVGMGACQGRICGAAMRHLRGWPVDTVRPPIIPTTVDTLVHASPLETQVPT
jgi:NADPH-dependent 2,4-dienoyl-CoA reductase/sulfur reductase-like enzyme